jgi:pSer/pThr/pTyr-binding forkhead associated (FHA) protein
VSQTERGYFNLGGEPAAHIVARIELDNGVTFDVNEASLPLRIGRDRACGLRIPSGHVSRQHCELDQVNGVLFIKDTSSNGTSVGRRTIKQESVSIQEPTAILLAGEARLMVTPGEAERLKTPIREERRSSSDRRAEDRRQDERRHKNVVVDFERRRDETRRRNNRRVAARR